MVPKIHARGSSFKGAAAYLLHDKDRAATAARVAWVETVNLSTRNPETAWRVMAATAMDAARLKADAGVKKTGRQSKDAVLHVSLSWSPDQAPDRAEMTAFARRALAALKAEDRQALIICHSDEKHPHVHLLVNRVSPADGRLLSSSNEKNALSALALAYEQEGGKILCEQRKENADRRESGEYVRGEKDVPRDEFEALRDAQEAAEAEVPAGAAQDRPEEVAALRRQSLHAFREKLAELRQRFHPSWAGLYARQRQERSDGQEERSSTLVREWLVGRVGQAGISLPFMRQSIRGAERTPAAQAKRQKHERTALAKSRWLQLADIVAELKRDYAEALGRLRSVYGPAARPSSDQSRALTPEQRRAMELNRRAARPAMTKGSDRDLEFEP